MLVPGFQSWYNIKLKSFPERRNALPYLGWEARLELELDDLGLEALLGELMARLLQKTAPQNKSEDCTRSSPNLQRS